PEDVVRGQYRGYRSEPGVAPDSKVETYAALRLAIDSWRWAGVPFFLRAGKRLNAAATEVYVQLKQAPQQVFGASMGTPNYLRFRLGPDRITIALGALAKKPGSEMEAREVELSVCDSGAEEMGAYERLIDAALHGDTSLFAREDGVLEAWRIVDPIVTSEAIRQGALFMYEPGSAGPASADALVADHGGWHTPAST
ncbi:MAG TPA: glucose-6-phosphate dehydrogenase, partial [Gammaproteobacteria bacterium]|nr:glucose-6-phosphate dehydrogenase [Gammaproteobacteria bacterium]